MADTPAVQQQKADIALEKERQLNAMKVEAAQQQYQQQAQLAALKQQSTFGNDGLLATKSSGNPLLDAVQQYQNQQQVNDPWGTASRSVLQTRLPQSDNPWENLLGGLAKGFVGGGLDQIGQASIDSSFESDLMPTLTNLYPQISDSLGPDSGIDASKISLIKALTDESSGNAIELALAKNPLKKGLSRLGGDKPYSGDIFGGDDLSVNLAGALPGVDEVNAAKDAVDPNKPNSLNDLLPNGAETLQDQIRRETEKNIASGMSPGTAGVTARQTFKPQLEASTQTLKTAEPLLESANALDQIAAVTNDVNPRLEKEGLLGPGFLSKAKREGALHLGLFGGATDIQDLLSQQDNIINANRIPGAGRLTNFLDQIYIKAGPSPDKTSEENNRLANRYHEVADLRRDDASLISWYLKQTGNDGELPLFMQQVDKVFPRYKMDSSGKPTAINPDRPNFAKLSAASKEGKLASLIDAIHENPNPQSQGVDKNLYSKLRSQGVPPAQAWSQAGG